MVYVDSSQFTSSFSCYTWVLLLKSLEKLHAVEIENVLFPSLINFVLQSGQRYGIHK